MKLRIRAERLRDKYPLGANQDFVNQKKMGGMPQPPMSQHQGWPDMTGQMMTGYGSYGHQGPAGGGGGPNSVTGGKGKNPVLINLLIHVSIFRDSS